MASSPAANAENQDQFIESDSFLKDPHSRLPRYITRRKDLSSNLKVLLGELYGRYCISGNLTFKTSTLADLCGLTIDQTRRAISEGRKKEMFVTTPTGRALSYKLIDQKYPRLINSECGPNHNQSAQKSALSNNIDFNKGLKETTTVPKPKPKPNPKPKSPPASPAEIAVVAEINNIKKIIEPEISLNRNAIEKLIGVDYDHIRYAKNEAMKPGTKNTNGLFIYLCNEEMSPMEKLKNGLDTVAVPKNIDGNSVEMRKITCYNRNVSNLTCTSILGTAPVTKECLQFCPFYVQRMEQDLKLYQKICVEIVHETDKAFLVHPVDSLNEHWIPKRVIKKQESYGDDSFLLTIPMSFELKNI